MTTLTDFLLARIAEDYAAADLVLRPYGDHGSTDDAEWWTDERGWFRMGLSSDETPLVMRMTPQRVLADCEAKRRIVEHCDASSQCGSYPPPGAERDRWLTETQETYGYTPPLHYPEEYAPGCDGCSGAESVTQNDGWILRYLVLPYADHPDYRAEWRP